MHLSMCVTLAAGVIALSVGCKSRAFNSSENKTEKPILKVKPHNEEASLAGTKLKFDEYKVLFTNPVCAEYKYSEPIKSVSGKTLVAKPRNTYCTQMDSKVSAARPEAPQAELLKWINDPSTKEIFFAYLSFSNKTVMRAVCDAITTRNVKVRFVVDSQQPLEVANTLAACKPADGKPESAPELFLRGHTNTGDAENDIGYSHNKLFIINPKGPKMRLAFSSGNMSSGIVLHHENWHFFTLDSSTYFAQNHLCLMNGVIGHATSVRDYAEFMQSCRKKIAAPQESDIRAFFIPGDTQAAQDTLSAAMNGAQKIDIAAHRFSFWLIKSVLNNRLRSQNPPKVRIVADDDTYWAGQGDKVGDNGPEEFANIMNLVNVGATVKFMETNHGGHLLHHNKYLIFSTPGGTQDAVWTGAGNLTGAAFNNNFENFYFIRMPQVQESFVKQYTHVWDTLATAPADLPAQNILPPDLPQTPAGTTPVVPAH